MTTFRIDHHGWEKFAEKRPEWHRKEGTQIAMKSDLEHVLTRDSNDIKAAWHRLPQTSVVRLVANYVALESVNIATNTYTLQETQ